MESSDPLGAPPAGALLAPRRRRVPFHLVAMVATWRSRLRGRRVLARFDERMLRDIGVDPAQVWQETRKWFWQP